MNEPTCLDASPALAASSTPSRLSIDASPDAAETSGQDYPAWRICHECGGTGEATAYGHRVDCDACIVGDEPTGRLCAWCGEPGRGDEDDLCAGCHSHASERREYADRATWDAALQAQADAAEAADPGAAARIRALLDELRASLAGAWS